MWRGVTRGLVLLLVSLVAATALAQQQPTQFVGALEWPDPAATQSGVVLVSGWAYDVQQITRIELYVDDQFQYNVNMGLPRIDISEAYANYPGIQNANPGFQTGFLASRFSNGPHTVEVRVYTTDGQIIPLGRRTVEVDNTINQPPFGYVDQPGGVGVFNASGSFPVAGWAADTDGIASVDVQVDGLELQSAIYGDSRPDVANTFPDFPAAAFSGFVANIDTTRLQDGVHLLTVRATDRLGVSRLIGRRQVQIFNSGGNLQPFGYLDEPRPNSTLYGTKCTTVPMGGLPPVNAGSHISPVRGWALDLSTRSDVGRVAYVELMIDGVRWMSAPDDCGYNPIFGAYVNCYGLPRYDVARYFPTYPDSPQSGFMFTLDVGALLALQVPPGRHIMKVRVGDQQGTFADLPNNDGVPVTFTCADTNADFAPIGYIDVPTTFDYLSGNAVFQGWAVDENGGVASVDMTIDGNPVGQASYGYARTDVRQAYPYISNSQNSGWRFTMDTTKLSNARHRLTVRVTDNAGHQAELASVDFYVQNQPPAN